MKNKKLVLIIVSILIIIGVLLLVIFKVYNNRKVKTDSEKFATEYKLETKSGEIIDNVFTYRSIKDIIKILKKGTGIVYLGFPECPWCLEYVKYLNEVSKKEKLDKIYYYNILDERKNNTKEYQEIVSILKDYLQYDDEGNKRVYVPAVIAVKDGEIVGFDDETAWDTKGYDNPSDYWDNEDLDGLKKKLAKMIGDIDKNICTSDCNK